MNVMPRALLLLFCALTFLPAYGADMPKRKSGLWEIKTNLDGQPGMTMQMCIDERQDDLLAQRSSDVGKDIRRQCPKLDTRQLGDSVVIDSVCKFDRFTATGHTVISGKLTTQYKMESDTRYDPPMHGMARSHTVVTGRWLGACKPGQTHGSMTFSGMPGGGKYNIDPEMLKQMQKMQQQQGK